MTIQLPFWDLAWTTYHISEKLWKEANVLFLANIKNIYTTHLLHYEDIWIPCDHRQLVAIYPPWTTTSPWDSFLCEVMETASWSLENLFFFLRCVIGLSIATRKARQSGPPNTHTQKGQLEHRVAPWGGGSVWSFIGESHPHFCWKRWHRRRLASSHHSLHVCICVFVNLTCCKYAATT